MRFLALFHIIVAWMETRSVKHHLNNLRDHYGILKKELPLFSPQPPWFFVSSSIHLPSPTPFYPCHAGCKEPGPTLAFRQGISSHLNRQSLFFNGMYDLQCCCYTLLYNALNVALWVPLQLKKKTYLIYNIFFYNILKNVFNKKYKINLYESSKLKNSLNTNVRKKRYL